MFRKLHLAKLSVVVAGLLSACAVMAADITSTPGELKVGMEITYPPFESYEGDKKIVGADVDLITALSKRLGLGVQFIDTKFPNLINGLNAGHYDAVISGMYVTPTREAQALAIPYAQSGASVLAPKGSTLKITKAEDLCGLKIGLLTASAWVAQFHKLSTDYCEPNGKGAIVINEYPSAPEVTQATLAHNVQVQVEMGAAADVIVQRTAGRVDIVSTTQIYPQTLGMYVRKGNEAVYNALLKALSDSKANGEYAKIMKKYNLVALPQ
jgi:polar amino acid transport system substrate-binding protein